MIVNLEISLCLVSQFAVEEYEALLDNLDLERDLRTKAEDFAREVSSLNHISVFSTATIV